MRSSRELRRELEVAEQAEQAEILRAAPPIPPTPPEGMEVVWGLQEYSWGDCAEPYVFYRRVEDAIAAAEKRVRELHHAESVVWRSASCHVAGERDYVAVVYRELQ